VTAESSSDALSPLGLCLSGGGFRAAFYVLGALRYIAEAGHLAQVKAVSAVSGGSIAAGIVADRWQEFENAGATLDAFLTTIDTPFRQVVTKKNLRNEWVRRALLHRGAGGRGKALAQTLAKNLYEHAHVSELPGLPQVIFTSTDLGVGRAFRIAHDFVGSYDHGYVEPAPSSLELGAAVAASAAFPASMSLLQLKTKDLGLPTAPEILSLVDGGVYDNLGLEWFQGWKSGRPKSAIRPGFVIVVNASGQLATTEKKYRALNSVFRDLSVQYAQTLNLRVRWFIADAISPDPDALKGAYIGIKHDPRRYKDVHGAPVDPAFYAGALPSELVEPLALLRTDLDRFLPEEADLLSYHAYWSLHARLKTVAPHLAVGTPAWQPVEYTNMPHAEKQRLVALLERGAHRAVFR
jgi:NTE family protein